MPDIISDNFIDVEVMVLKKVRIISLIVLVVTAFISLDLLINLLGSMIPTMNDGIGTYSIIWGNLYFGDRLWSNERFFNAFVTSALITFAVFVENVILAIVDMVKK